MNLARVLGEATLVALLLAACSDPPAQAVTETVAAGPLLLEARGDGVLRSSRPTPLQVPGNGWSSRRIEWMLPEGSRVKKGELIARFSSEESEQDLAQALVDLQRNALARAAKGEELASAEGRVGVDMEHGRHRAVGQREQVRVDVDLALLEVPVGPHLLLHAGHLQAPRQSQQLPEDRRPGTHGVPLAVRQAAR